MSKRREYLDARNKEIRQLRMDGLTLREIGEKHGVTREAIRLICKGIPKPDLKTYHEKECVNCGKTFTKFLAITYRRVCHLLTQSRTQLFKPIGIESKL